MREILFFFLNLYHFINLRWKINFETDYEGSSVLRCDIKRRPKCKALGKQRDRCQSVVCWLAAHCHWKGSNCEHRSRNHEHGWCLELYFVHIPPGHHHQALGLGPARCAFTVLCFFPSRWATCQAKASTSTLPKVPQQACRVFISFRKMFFFLIKIISIIFGCF